MSSIIKNTSKIIKHSPICIIGSGSGSLDTASILKRQDIQPQHIRVFDRARTHYYQSGFTMVGGGLVNMDLTHRTRDSLFDKLICQTYSHVAKVDPENNMLETEDGELYTYDQLVIAAGNILKYENTKGAVEALDDPSIPVTSIYSPKYVEKVINNAKELKKGNALFNVAQMPIKCGGAPHKICYLLEDLWRKNGVRENIKIQQHVAGGLIFGQPKYGEAIAKQYQEKNIPVHFFQNIVEIKGKDRVTVFQDMKTQELTEKPFDFLHFVPLQVAPSFIRESGLSDANGYTDVDPYTLQHKKYKNIWGLGDSSNCPTSKTFSSITQQAPILVKNLVTVMKKQGDINNNPKYDGYTCCPLLIGHKKLILAEFKYDAVADETFYKKQEKPNSLFYWLKLHFFPWVYWNFVKRGIWFGRDGLRFKKL